MINDLSVPIMIEGRHWGAVRIGFDSAPPRWPADLAGGYRAPTPARLRVALKIPCEEKTKKSLGLLLK
ncbi:MAG: hypothetical protein WAZ34_16820 [Rhodocyclaceae bacterium]